VKVDLSKDLTAAKAKLKELLKVGGPDQVGTIGVIGHSGNQKFGFQHAMHTTEAPQSDRQKKTAIHTLIGEYHMKVLKVYTQPAHDEKEAGLKTV